MTSIITDIRVDASKMDVSSSEDWTKSFTVKRAYNARNGLIVPIVATALVVTSTVTTLPDYVSIDRNRSITSVVTQGKTISKSISRSEVIRRCRKIIEQAEYARIDEPNGNQHKEYLLRTTHDIRFSR